MSDTARPPRGEAVKGASGGGASGQSPGPGPGGGRGGHAMGPMGGMGRPTEKPKDFGKTMRRLLAYLKPHRGRLVAVVLLAILSMSFNIVSPKIQGHVMDKLKDAFVARMVMGGGAAGAAPTAGSTMAPAAGQGPSGLTEAQMADARRALRETGGKVDYAGIGRILLTLLALYVLASLFMFVTQWVMSTVAQMTVSKL
ncbi:MAG TPA: hypothetical protein VMV44_07855, partial [Rectinemataceae bacterium]|nr:hypothetical protein [Rectinemataceae bacterium]